METGPATVAPAPEPEPELLEAGPATRKPNRVVTIVTLAVLAVLAAGLLAWQFWPRPVAPFTLDELEGVYAGMVRGDGTNDASVMHRGPDVGGREVSPAECQPLFDPTTFSRFPTQAVDGVGTYWIAERVGTSLTTFRFTDAEQAEAAYRTVATALASCSGREVRVREQRTRTVEVRSTPIESTSGMTDQLAYLYAPGATSRFAVQVLRYENLVTWQFRYDTADGEYAPESAQQVMDSLAAQMRSIVDLRP